MKQNVTATMKVYHIVYGLLITFLSFHAIMWCLRKANKMNIDEQADLVVRKREDRSYKFKIDLEQEKITEIITMDVAALRQGLLEKEFTCVDLVNIFGKRCMTIARGLNLTSQENFRAALKLAEARDEELNKAIEEGEEAVANLGLMFGIPFSVQDPINLKGKFSTYGMKYLCDQMRDEDAVVVK